MRIKKHVHFIGICGVGMGAIAVMFQKMGWKVLGSDKGFWPPISDFLRTAKIDFYPGWHPEKINAPDLVIMGNFISLKNPEYLAAKKKGLTIKSYPEILAEYVIKKNSVVVAGTFGKTTIAAFLTHAFKIVGKNPSWFVGGLAKNLKNGAGIRTGDWSIVEGDEYNTARWDMRPKFMLYRPTHLVLTAVNWDHLDIYPKEKLYDQAFENLIKIIPKNGKIVAARRQNGQKIDKIIAKSRAPIIRYGKKELIKDKNGYGYEITSLNENGSEFVVYHQNKILGPFKTGLLGEHLVENLTAGIALSCVAGLDLKQLQKAVSTFQGVKRRLEIRDETKKIKIIDDLAHSPAKAQASLKALRLHFPHAGIFAVYEPNVGFRSVSSKELYQNAFDQADVVIIPRLSKTKTNEEQEQRMEGKKLAEIIGQKNKGTRVLYMENDNELTKFLAKEAKPKDIIVFLGSHGFRGMIEQTMLQISKF